MIPRPIRALALTVALAVLVKSQLPAGPLPSDAVEEFKQALLLENNKRSKYKDALADRELDEKDKRAVDYALAFRRKNLERTANQLKTVSDLSRALLLIEWPRPPRTPGEIRTESEFDRGAREIEREVRDELAKRFMQQVRETIKNDATTRAEVARQVATANLVGETVSSTSDQQDEHLSLHDTLRPLVNALAGLVTAPDHQVREAAARALGQFPNSPKVAAEALQRLLHGSNPVSTRKAAADGLLSLAQAVSSSQPMRGSEPGVSVREARRYSKLLTLSEVAPVAKEVARAAGSGLGDSSVLVRRQCANAMRQAVESLAFEIKLLRPVSSAEVDLTPIERVREGQWSKLEKERVQKAREANAENINSVMPTLRAFRDQGRALLRAALDPDPQVRLNSRRALDSLSQTRELISQTRKLVPSVNGKEGVHLRQPTGATIHPVGLRQEKDNKEKKKDEDTDKETDPIGELLRQVGEGLVRSGFNDPLAESRRAALEAFESMGSGGAEFIPRAVEMLEDKDPFVRWIAARALGKLAPRMAELVVPALTRGLDDPDLDARSSMARALGLYGEAAAGAVPALAAHLLKGDAEVRISVMKAIEGVGTDAVGALPNLARQLRDIDPRVRGEAARVMGRFGPLARAHVEALRGLSADPDAEVRKAASASILTILAK